MIWIIFVLAGFLLGSLPFSVWLSKSVLKKDVRKVGDGNPGATNVLKSGSKGLALLVLMLDVSKAAVPVGLAYNQFAIRGLPMVLVALAPMLGHAFSPFLKFKGGKALATTLGVWIGLTIWKTALPALIGVGLGMAFFTLPGWAVLFALLCILVSLLLWLPQPILLWVWVGQVIILTWTHRRDLVQKLRLRPWLRKLLRFHGEKDK